MKEWGWYDDVDATCKDVEKTKDERTQDQKNGGMPLSVSGYDRRMKFTKEGNSFHLTTPLFIDFLTQNRALLPGCALEFALTKSDNNFFLLGKDVKQNKYVLKIEKLEVQLRLIKPIREVIDQLNKELVRGGVAIYPVTKAQVSVYTHTHVCKMSSKNP